MTPDDWAEINENKKPKTYYDFTPLTLIDLMIIVSAAESPLMAVLFNLCYWTGIEIHYLLEMTYGDLTSVPEGILSIYYTYGIVSGVEISESLQQMLAPYIGAQYDDEFLYTHEDGSTWTPAYVDGEIEKISQSTGIKFTAKTLRDSYYAASVFNVIPAKSYGKRRKAMKEAMAA